NVDAATTLTGNSRGVLLSGPNARLVESVKPSLTLTGAPPAQTSDTSAFFSFTFSDNLSSAGDLLVQYSLDGGAFVHRTSPVSLAGLALGSHTFLLRATDQAGNVQTTSTYAWTVSNAPPTTTPTPIMPSLGAGSDTGPSDSDGITNDGTPTFTGTA